MKNYLNIFCFLLCSVIIFSCKKSDDELEVDEEWKIKNEAAFSKIAADPSYTEIPGYDESVYYKVLEEGNGTEPIYITSKVKVYYEGSLIDGTVFDSKVYPDNDPAEFTVSSLIRGWSMALQQMKVGDKWELWIPSELGYGRAGQSSSTVSILPYSTLHFIVEVVEITEQ